MAILFSHEQFHSIQMHVDCYFSLIFSLCVFVHFSRFWLLFSILKIWRRKKNITTQIKRNFFSSRICSKHVRFDDFIKMSCKTWLCVGVPFFLLLLLFAVSNVGSLLRMMRIVCHSDKRQVLFACFFSVDVGAKTIYIQGARLNSPHWFKCEQWHLDACGQV